MIAYLETSAVVPLLVAEPTTPLCRMLWDEADAVVCSRLLYVEAAAALAQAHRMARLTSAQHTSAAALLDELWPEFDIADVDEAIVQRAAELARRLALRGYDAVHCASAEQLAHDDLVAVSGDKALVGAWMAIGLSVLDTNAPDER